MTDLLTPDDARELEKYLIGESSLKELCRNYITLWDKLNHERQISDDVVKELMFERDRNKKLEEHHKQFVQKVALDIAALTQQVRQL